MTPVGFCVSSEVVMYCGSTLNDEWGWGAGCQSRLAEHTQTGGPEVKKQLYTSDGKVISRR